MALHLKHRPATLEDVRGNKGAKAALESILSRKRRDIPHAMLFTGPKGCGKTTLARIVAATLGCEGRDLQEMNSAQYRGIDTVRDLQVSTRLAAMDGSPCRIWILDEVHALTKDAQQGLLKLLEDTPKHVYILLATTDPEKLLPTVRDRCTKFEVKPLSEAELVELMMDVVKAEGKTVTKTMQGVMEQIAIDCNGSSRSALVILDTIIDLPEKNMAEAAKQQAAAQNEAIDLCRLLFKKPQWKDVAAVVKNLDQDPETVRRMVLGYCSSVLLSSGNPQAYVVMDAFAKNFYDTGKPGLVMACFEAVNGR